MSGTDSASSCKITLNLSDKAKQGQPEVTGVENIINAERLKDIDFRTSPDSHAVTELMQEEENFQRNDFELGDNSEPTSVEFDKELFIEEVRKYRCLWDINSKAYKLLSKMHGPRLEPFSTKMSTAGATKRKGGEMLFLFQAVGNVEALLAGDNSDNKDEDFNMNNSLEIDKLRRYDMENQATNEHQQNTESPNTGKQHINEPSMEQNINEQTMDKT
ncbi:Hypothetical predicted protein [Paramuricea clavata]|uniref:Uncharacterized protein n=1 Tax=Paramuricea clavata TaxID=317549 RepID=A0A6S7H7S4_PARCT|nr:Hypothetical predicted protein [Paramuricea clavata]